MEKTGAVEKSGQCAYKLQNRMLKHQMTAISKLKNGKATGHDQVSSELIKQERNELKEVIYKLI
jgi:hypothetical protein